ncbi:uncharacterized protein LOC123806845 isoform X2 [Phyllostomus hastatus]|uniref:uncharacterized protein LOC123806845 isoform X2 n=1 Tax=Phyllostomus hastatus TaxID=9423 RepID=UPI001E680DDD|nr:uncharacterized protein LOC123806845 isoform X2 [Phyllostomus hastatus]
MKSSRERKELTGLDGGSQVSRGRGKAEGAPRFAVGSVRELRGEGEGRGWQRRGVVQTLEVCPRPQLRSCREEVGGAAAVAIGEEKGQAAPVSEDGGRRPSWRRKPWRQSPLSAGLKGNAPCCAASPSCHDQRKDLQSYQMLQEFQRTLTRELKKDAAEFESEYYRSHIKTYF